MTNYITRKTFTALRERYQELLERERSLADEISHATSFGDVGHENAEFDAARETWAGVRQTLHRLEKALHNVQLIDDLPCYKGVVALGTQVTVRYIETDEIGTFLFLGPEDIEYWEDVMTLDSPIGQKVLGHQVGDKIAVVLPGNMKKTLVIQKIKNIFS